jgi:hypothetical protein
MPQSSAPNSPTTSSAASPAADGRRPLAPRAPEALGFHEVLYAKGDGVARITLNRPTRYNAYPRPRWRSSPPPSATPPSTTRWA